MYIDCVDIEFRILNVKFQDNQTSGSEKKHIFKVFNTYGHGSS